MRASREYAPGPSRTIAAVIITTKKTVDLALDRFGVVAGNHERRMLIPPRPNRVLATGVRNPISNSAPQAMANKPTAQIPSVGLVWSDKQATP